ncbi:MAG: family 10 glycosylhydrolase [Clostridia bacterium]|nr:family 10 glycosylhydrolase [Clostridia bacterium]
MTKTLKAICIVLGLVCSLKMLLPQESSSVLAEDISLKGVWAATLYSMDYPSAPTKDADILRTDAQKLVDDTAKHGFNTLFLQVRPTGDAFYKSEIYPWSKYLTGSEGTAPDSSFDPLAYIIDQAHKKGISVHAWLNPYRLTASEKDADSLSGDSIAKKFPHLTVKHTDGKLYLNPGEPEAMQLVIDGAVEIVKNYDIDGIHIDDYFYPSSAFPDGETFTKYGGGFLDIGDWRRNNTTTLVKELRAAIKAVRQDVLFSVSPCGIWANKSSNPEGSDTSGKQAYYDYYADTRLWVKEELVDIIIPQIYWNIGYSLADFEKVATWWNDTVSDTNVALCIGQGVYKAAEETAPSSPWYGENGHKELKRQLDMINTLENCKGFVQYRLGSIIGSPELSEFLAAANTAEATLFTDTKNYPWAKDAIESLYKKGIVRGMGDGTFGAARNITRADFTVMLVRLTEQNVPFTENFADVTEDKYYYKEVGIAKVLGFATGREGNIFDPGANITREDMATLAWRVLNREGTLKDTSDLSLNAKFSDANEISEYARIAVSVMVEENLLNGYETGEFKPKGLATRAECAVLLDKISNLR